MLNSTILFLIPLFFFVLYHFVVLENYELSEGRSPGETTLSDIPAVLARRKDMCDNMVRQFFIVLVKIIFLLIFYMVL
jgi:hypothetical protein